MGLEPGTASETADSCRFGVLGSQPGRGSRRVNAPVPDRWTASARAWRCALLDGGAEKSHRAVAVWREALTPEERHHAAVLAMAAAEPTDVLDLLHRLAGRQRHDKGAAA
jgi:hypothetical protein